MSDAAAIVYLNGAFLPIGEAKVPVLDRGFIFGDGVYEVIPVYGREPFRMPHHLARLAHSCAGIGLVNPHGDAEWERLVRELASRQPFDDQAVYLQVTRGVAKRDHAFPKGVAPTVFMMSNPLPSPTREQVERGVAVITAEDNRWQRCDLKTISLLGNVLMRQLAAEAGAIETVMFRDGCLTEASASNVLIVKHGTIVAPPKDHLILPGITRGPRRRRDVAVVVDEGSRRRDEARRQAVRRRGAWPGVPSPVGGVPGAQARDEGGRQTRPRVSGDARK